MTVFGVFVTFPGSSPFSEDHQVRNLNTNQALLRTRFFDVQDCKRKIKSFSRFPQASQLLEQLETMTCGWQKWQLPQPSKKVLRFMFKKWCLKSAKCTGEVEIDVRMPSQHSLVDKASFKLS